MTKSKEVTTKQESLPAEVSGNWGYEHEASSQDMIIAKILPMQGMSEMVTNGTAKFGELRGSINGELLGDADHPMEFIPLKMFKTWVQFINKNGKKEFDSIIPVTPENANSPWKENVGGTLVERDYALNFYVINPKDIEDGGLAVPYLVSFRRTSLKAGKKLSMQMQINGAAGKPPAAMVMNLIPRRVQNNEGTYIVMDVTKNRPSTSEELFEAKKWFDTVNQQDHKVDNSDVDKKEANYASDDVSF